MMTKSFAVTMPSIARRCVIRSLTLILALGLASRAQAAFHLWNITEVYSNSSGTLQFIEMFDSFGGQQSLAGQSINVTNLAGTVTNTFTIPGNFFTPIDSLNHSLLFGTTGLHAAGGPTPDFIIPNGFLFTAGGTIDFFGFSGSTNDLTYSPLPTDGIHSLAYANGPSVINSPRNYSGQTGQVVPEPGAITLAIIGGAWASCFLRRRRCQSA
jgi:hypothetical protein